VPAERGHEIPFPTCQKIEARLIGETFEKIIFRGLKIVIRSDIAEPPFLNWKKR
jgi:hypothetical protein